MKFWASATDLLADFAKTISIDMPKIHIEINKAVDFNIDIYDDPISQIFFQQHQRARAEDPVRSIATINDPTKYTISYFIDRVEYAKTIGAIDWTQYSIKPGLENYENNQRQFNAMHKDLEVAAGINKYAGLNPEQRDVINDLHCCLHSLETTQAPMDYNFQVRNVATFNYYMWTSDMLSVMPEPVKFRRSIEPGEVNLDYGYVGKEPIHCAIHNDNSMLQQTCKMIDRVSLSWRLYLGKTTETRWGPDPWPDDIDATLTKWYYENKEDMDALGYTLQKILDHAGFYPIGRVDDLSKLDYLRNTPNIQVTGYELIN